MTESRRGLIIPQHRKRLEGAIALQKRVWKIKEDDEALSALMGDIIQHCIDMDINPRRMFNAAFTAAYERRKQMAEGE